MLLLNIIYVLLAIGMIALILMQRGSGAQAGAGFGGGASGTVFGARGSANFLSKATKWLAISFFAITLFMAWYATRQATAPQAGTDLGVMSQVPAAPATPAAVPGAPQPSSAVPAAPQQPAAEPAAAVPAAPAQQEAVPAAQDEQ